MVYVKTPEEIEKIRAACAVVRDTFAYLGRHIAAGMTTKEVDTLVHDYIVQSGATPSPVYAFSAWGISILGMSVAAVVGFDKRDIH